MPSVQGRYVTTRDSAGNATLSNAGDHGMDKQGNWWGRHPISGLSVSVKFAEPPILNPNNTITTTYPFTVTDAFGVSWRGNLINSVWVS